MFFSCGSKKWQLPDVVAFEHKPGKYFYDVLGYRKPLKGEYFLSGAEVKAYLAYNDLSYEYLVVVPTYRARSKLYWERGNVLTGETTLKTINELLEEQNIAISLVHEIVEFRGYHSADVEIVHQVSLSDTIADVLKMCIGGRTLAGVLTDRLVIKVSKPR